MLACAIAVDEPGLGITANSSRGATNAISNRFEALNTLCSFFDSFKCACEFIDLVGNCDTVSNTDLYSSTYDPHHEKTCLREFPTR